MAHQTSQGFQATAWNPFLLRGWFWVGFHLAASKAR